MRKNVENKLRKDIEDRQLPCPHCDSGIPWKTVSHWYTSSIGSLNHGRPMTSEEGKRMVIIRWGTVAKSKKVKSENNKA